LRPASDAVVNLAETTEAQLRLIRDISTRPLPV
jgi:hypothetical protein